MICTYPKCGTTWMQNIVHLLLHNGEPFAAGCTLDDEMLFLEYDSRVSSSDLSILKTHLPLNMLSWSEQAKYIVIARNPKDCCVSFFHHTRGYVDYYDYAHGTFDDYFPRFLNGQVDFGSFFDHFASWEPRFNDPNVFFCTYEEMICDIKDIVLRLAMFLDVKLGDNLLEKVIQHSSFKSMRKDEKVFTGESPKDTFRFIRKGEIGDWHNYFNEEQSRLIDMKVKQYPLMKKLWAKYI
ncbi:unnamed protein product [Rotaria sp. Silwood1]|nr:unnamed protein product [Rotaria sp. Silwood1]CAF1281554.1 unnamed protein product [Rotaria sp. Silwood1]CAF1615213.1 unnamed protein product [Rotaria sp. Silwood1]CAF1622558.1 unnamed protein product [Rotaria sp. Silwood1]